MEREYSESEKVEEERKKKEGRKRGTVWFGMVCPWKDKLRYLDPPKPVEEQKGQGAHKQAQLLGVSTSTGAALAAWRALGKALGISVRMRVIGLELAIHDNYSPVITLRENNRLRQIRPGWGNEKGKKLQDERSSEGKGCIRAFVR
ncbi:hypothetical protein GX51_05406 [Blastomyces parvus]|uniref:Uncharacterized protein n=1 Tax=Blastomyces parvus TaxID=2060905 RepID=A0A2B7WX66_9EURO|nr:hypothetical protein GX51_05406 [Blastomyces parvus]